MQIGIGYDVHPLVPGRKLILGGVTIPYDRGLSGWSDADVLIHAIIDALLGAAALGDRGSHFPPDDPQYRDISSLVLLERTKELLAQRNWRASSVDATIMAEQPKLRDYIELMRQNLSQMLGIDISQVSIKASTSAGLGFIGRGEGIATLAVASVESIS